MLLQHQLRTKHTIDRMVIPCGSQALPRVYVRQEYRSWAMDWEQAILREIVKCAPHGK